MTEIKPNYTVEDLRQWIKDMPTATLPDSWIVKILSEKNSRIHPHAWRLGQIGMVGNVIKPADQTGVPEGKIRVIFVSPLLPYLSNCPI